MARQRYFTNARIGLSGSIRCLASEDIQAGSIVTVVGTTQNIFTVALFDCTNKKKSTGILLVAPRKMSMGGNIELVPYCSVPYVGEGKAGDPLFATRKGKWGTKSTKTSIQVGFLVEGKTSLEAVLAPQGRY